MDNHYKVLGLSRTATKEEIKQAFRNLALQFHPDKHSFSPKSIRDDATRKFKQASEAYDVLIDDKKRVFYDNSLNSNHNYGYRGKGYGNYGSHSTNRSGYGSYRKSSNVSGFEVFFRYMGTRDFLIKLVFAGGKGYGNYGSNPTNSSGYGRYRKSSNVSGFEVFFQFMGTRDFLIKLVSAGGLLGASYLISSGGEALWKMRNSGKSFEEVMETKEKSKAVKYEKI